MIRTDDTDDAWTLFCLQKSLNSCDQNAGPLFVTIVAGTPYLANHSRHLEDASIPIIHCLSC
ncbi:hypothetical protein T02_15642 [Trichinella nativa]|uniref:Uncharacterized protein n=2 Tax=Trichinella TaxID=6333 RepID=A0A0V1KXF2_9BILA|nr:hypothetical protein T06_10668 [Trichinella sp. T6]KRZ51830.1 hypothetical protein T02_15642 [Trichinella nativa]OUC42061.1 hypothetical protein D917_10477 [Trichinella nativa]